LRRAHRLTSRRAPAAAQLVKLAPLLLAAAAAAAALAVARASPADGVVSYASAIALPGVTDATGTAKVDHNVLLDARGLLFLSVKENDTVAVIDLNAGAFLSSTPVPHPQGAAYSPALDALFFASSTAGAVYALAASPPFNVLWSTPAGGFPDADNIRCADVNNGSSTLVWVAYGGGANGDGRVAVVSATLAGGVVVDGVDVGADHPEEINLSPIAARLYVSAPAADTGAGGGVFVVDTGLPGPHEVAYWAGEPGWASPYAQRLDATGTRLWVATAGLTGGAGSQLVALNAVDGTALFAAPTGAAGGACDDVVVDDDGGLVLCARGGEGASRLYVVQQTATTPGPAPPAGAAWAALGSVDGMPQTLTNARGLALRRSTRALYLAVPYAAASGGAPEQPAQLLVFSLAGAPPPGGDNDADGGDGGLSPGGWAGVAVGAALAGAALGGLGARRFYGGGGHGHSHGADAPYMGLNN